jgi:hypothetical protein
MAQRVTQTGAVVGYEPDETNQRVTQAGAVVGYAPDQTNQRVTQVGVLVAYVEGPAGPAGRPSFQVIWIE